MSGGVRAGELSERVEVRPVKLVQDSDTGQELKTYPVSLRYKLWMKVNAVSGNEKYKNGREMNTIMYRFKTRYTKKLKATDVLAYNGMCFDIQDLSPAGTHNREYVTIMAEVMEGVKI